MDLYSCTGLQTWPATFALCTTKPHPELCALFFYHDIKLENKSQCSQARALRVCTVAESFVLTQFCFLSVHWSLKTVGRNKERSVTKWRKYLIHDTSHSSKMAWIIFSPTCVECFLIQTYTYLSHFKECAENRKCCLTDWHLSTLKSRSWHAQQHVLVWLLTTLNLWLLQYTTSAATKLKPTGDFPLLCMEWLDPSLVSICYKSLVSGLGWS